MSRPSRPDERSGTQLGLCMCTALVVGNMMGSGIFLLPASLAKYGGISIVGWLFTSTGAVCLALVFARLARNIPRPGGPYAYSREAFGDFSGFLVAWGYWIAIWIGNAAIAVTLVGYLAVFIPPLVENRLLSCAVALGFIWLLTAVNSVGVRAAGIVQIVTTILKIIPLIAIGAFGLAHFHVEHFIPLNLSDESTFSAINSTAALTLWAMLGLESATIPADNVREPAYTIPRATVIGTLIAAVVYILTTVAIMGAISPDKLAGSSAPFADAAALLWGPFAGYCMAAVAVVACLGALNGWILLQGQIPCAAAVDGVFPYFFARRTSSGTPVLGLVVSSGLCTLLVLIKHSESQVELFTLAIQLSTLTTLLPYVLSSGAALVTYSSDCAHTTARHLVGPFIVGGLALTYSIWAVFGLDRQVVGLGALLLLAGVPVYAMIKRGSGESLRNG